VLEAVRAEEFAVVQRRLAEEYLLAVGFVAGRSVPRIAWQLALFVSSVQLRGLSVEPRLLSLSLLLLEMFSRSDLTGTDGPSKTPLTPLPNSRIAPNLRN